MHPYALYRRIFASALVLGVLSVPSAWFMAGADSTIPRAGLTRACLIGAVGGVIVASIIVMFAFTYGELFWRWVGVATTVTLPICCICLGATAWLFAGEFEWRTQGSADDTMVALAVSAFVVAYLATVGIQGLFILADHLDNREVKSFTVGGRRRLLRPVAQLEPSQDASILTEPERERPFLVALIAEEDEFDPLAPQHRRG